MTKKIEICQAGPQRLCVCRAAAHNKFQVSWWDGWGGAGQSSIHVRQGCFSWKHVLLPGNHDVKREGMVRVHKIVWKPKEKEAQEKENYTEHILWSCLRKCMLQWKQLSSHNLGGNIFKTWSVSSVITTRRRVTHSTPSTYEEDAQAVHIRGQASVDE